VGTPAKIGFIGLGKMGHGMAGRMLDAGFDVALWNRNPAKADALISRGARRAATPAEAARAADAIVSMVADDEASRAVWLGADGVAMAANAGAVAIECSTVSHQHALDLAAALRARGLIYIDCPVTGLPDAAARGELTLLIGAEPSDLDTARPYLAPLGRTIRHFGPVGTGTVYKLINNLMGAIQIAGIAEGIAIAEQAGLDMALVREAIVGSVVASPQVLRHAPRMIDRDFANATFTAALRHKDARYAIELAKALRLELPLSRAAVASYARATDAAPDDDEAKIVEVVSTPRPRD